MMDTEKLWTLIHRLEAQNRLLAIAVEQDKRNITRIWQDERDVIKGEIAKIIGKPRPY